MSPQFKTFLASLVFFAVLFLMVATALGSPAQQEKTLYKLCMTAKLEKSEERGCWTGKSLYGVPYQQWLKQVEPKAIYIKTLAPPSGGVAKIYYKEGV